MRYDDRMELRAIADSLEALCADQVKVCNCLCCCSARRIRAVLGEQPVDVPRGQRPDSEGFRP